MTSTKTTWLRAIRAGNKHFPELEETQYGHMRTQRQGVRSTKVTAQQTTDDATEQPSTDEVTIRVHDTNETLFTDQTEQFPTTSSRGNRYQMILYHNTSNSIWVEPMKNRTEGEIIAARERALKRMKQHGVTPTKQVFTRRPPTQCSGEGNTSMERPLCRSTQRHCR